MERDPSKEPEQIVTEIVPEEAGLWVTVIRTDRWKFNDQREALNHFNMSKKKYSTIKWGLRGLIVGGFLQAAFGVERAVQTGSILLGVSSVATGVLTVIIRELNERAIELRIRESREIVEHLKRMQQPYDDSF